jgi:rieske iron-sulfur protein
MAEESKDTKASQEKSSEAEKKPAAPPVAPAPPPRPVAAATVPPRPAVVPPRTPAPAPAAPAQPPKSSSRRTFLRALVAVGAVLSIIPFVPWGNFLTSSVEKGSGKTFLVNKVVVDARPDINGPAAGMAVNVNDLTNFPAPDPNPAKAATPGNGHWQFTFPSSGDPNIDAYNPDTFVKWELIRLPETLGGTSKKATDFVAFSKVCVHLWCSPSFKPQTGHQQYECPCHGSIYEVPDGKAVQGPASLQAFPTNAIPMLTLQADSSGQLWVVYPNRDPRQPFSSDGVNAIEANGSIGYGRDYASYQNFIKPIGETPLDPKGESEEIVS